MCKPRKTVPRGTRKSHGQLQMFHVEHRVYFLDSQVLFRTSRLPQTAEIFRKHPRSSAISVCLLHCNCTDSGAAAGKRCRRKSAVNRWPADLFHFPSLYAPFQVQDLSTNTLERFGGPLRRARVGEFGARGATGNQPKQRFPIGQLDACNPLSPSLRKPARPRAAGPTWFRPLVRELILTLRVSRPRRRGCATAGSSAAPANGTRATGTPRRPGPAR